MVLQLIPLETFGERGEKISALVSKLRSEWIFSSKNRFDLWLIALIFYLPFWIVQFRNSSKVLPYSWFFVVGFSGTIFLDSGLYSRIAFCLGVIPFVSLMLTAANKLRKEVKMKFFDIRFVLYSIFCAIIILPGFYLPPFFDGIAGWTVKSEDINLNKVVYDRLEVTDFSGNTAPFPYPCFSPITQEYRFLAALNFANKNPFVNIEKNEFISRRSRFFEEAF